MIELKILWHEKAINRDKKFASFCQKLANRLIQGYFRYGPARSEQKYYIRLGLEYKEFKKTGNAEHLYNIANYCFLEIEAPSHPKFHFNNKVDSSTRGKI